MPTNDFKPFATAGGANVSTQAEYLALAALSTGWQSGKASSKEVNKAVRQATFIAAALAQFVSDKGAVDVLDDGNLAGFGTNLIAAMNKTSQPLDATLTALAALVGAANKLPYFNGAETAALTDLTQVGRDIIGKADVAAVLTYLGLGAFISTPSAVPSAFSQVNSPDNTRYLFIANNDTWGAQDAGGKPLPLPVSGGGSGAGTPAGARTAFGLGDSATKNVGTAQGTVAAGNDPRLVNLKSAANRDVGTSANQIPDMSAFTSGTGWVKFPDGTIFQRGQGATTTAGNTTINLPVAFASDYTIVGACVDPNVANILAISKLNNSQFQAKTFAEGVVATVVHFIAWGK